MDESTCIAPECDKPVLRKKWGMCGNHYQKALAAGELQGVSKWRHRMVDGVCVECGPGAKVITVAKGRIACKLSSHRSRSKLRFGMTQDQIEAKLEDIGHRCEICLSVFGPGNPFCIDHDHSCCEKSPTCGKCTRGFLCRRCNVAIGMLQDRPERADAAGKYLREKQENLLLTLEWERERERIVAGLEFEKIFNLG